jgi:hypothetical protein
MTDASGSTAVAAARPSVCVGISVDALVRYVGIIPMISEKARRADSRRYVNFIVSFLPITQINPSECFFN